MLSLGLTGGIAAGKSLLADRFRALGAVVIDADRLAREVLAPGTAGLAAVVDHFGAAVLLPDGSLDRPALGAVVFSDTLAREALNGIVHPLVRAAAATLQSDAGPGAIVVQDIPLLVETGQGPSFHLVVVAQAPGEIRVARMVNNRGMSRDDALARMAAQATDEQRAAAADVVIANDGTRDEAVAALDALWHGRLLPFAGNLAAGRAAADAPGWEGHGPAAADAGGTERLLARLRHALADLAAVEALQGDAAFGIRVAPAAGADPEEVRGALAGAGFFALAGSANQNAGRVGAGAAATVLASADPGQRAVLGLERAAVADR